MSTDPSGSRRWILAGYVE
ncbi:hypothetical protein E2C01_086620 [Portunus trituberculatus]|uniref:Uncharacterized protein n=1 Tax=Portunus trituberculatus TaxID=210409 RepID=A0A5B7JA74_PORTR|nr:hypothetical protein [Portunus trituberculatus]